jgi:hypothetical protein
MDKTACLLQRSEIEKEKNWINPIWQEAVNVSINNLLTLKNKDLIKIQDIFVDYRYLIETLEKAKKLYDDRPKSETEKESDVIELAENVLNELPEILNATFEKLCQMTNYSETTTANPESTQDDWEMALWKFTDLHKTLKDFLLSNSHQIFLISGKYCN